MNHFMTSPLRALAMLAFSGWALLAQATTYYVSPNGNDANSGTSESQAWRTIARVNQLSFGLQPGDAVLFQKGGTYRGTLVVASSGTTTSPITIGAYGTGAKPVISGSSVVTGWTVHQGNIWKAPLAGPVKMLFSNGQLMTLARYPNTGWLRNDQGTSTSLNDDALTQPAGYWAGAEVVIRGSNWSYDISQVTGSSNGQLQFTDMYMPLDTLHWGYFLRNKLSELDQPGEWYHDAAAGMLYFRAPSNADPNTLSIEASVRDRGAWVYMNWHHVVLDGLKFKHQYERAVFVDAAHHITVRNCTFEDLGMGVFSYGNNNLFEANTFNRTFQTAISLLDNNSTVRTSSFTDIAMQPGLGETNWGYMGIRVQGNDNAVRDNHLETVGYIGISVHGNTMVERNFVRNALALLNDGCGIGMENADGVIVRDNIILDIEGNLESAAPNFVGYWQAGMGIYFGNVSVKNTLVQNNTIANCKGAGIHVDHTMVSTGNQIKDNVLFNNAIQLSISDFSNYNGPGATPPYHVPAFNTVYSGNVMYSLEPGQLCMKQMHCWSTNWVDFGNFTNNRYFNPYNEVSIQQFNTQGSGIRNFYLEKWQQVTGEDAGSTRSPLRLETKEVTSVLSNNLLTNGAFDAGIGGWQGWPSQGQMTHSYAQLDNGSMRVDFTNNSTANNFYLTNVAQYQVQSGQWYRLKFSVISNMLGTMEAGVKTQTQMTGPQMVVREAIPFTTERRDVTMLFQSNITDQGFCSFMNNYQEGTYWIDNIELHRVTVQPLDPHQRHVLLYNELGTPANVPLTGCWSDVNGQLRSGTITIPAFSSVVLIKEDDILCGLTTGVDEEPTANAGLARVFPNPVQQGGELSVPAMNGGGEVQLFDAGGRLLRSITLREGQRSIDLDDAVTPGSYLLVARGDSPWRARVVVQ
ncbi:MAG: right-handed parallel beta-helix repeat-containing protein [Flavobacteriales bacterium]|nr:right-handed parallel beta-helix repeat-containing protein [Flavobacteriales bacterium]